MLVTFGIFAFRDLLPLGTYNLSPADAQEGRLLWAKLAVLTFTAVVIPLFEPRPYATVESSVRLAPSRYNCFSSVRSY